MSNEQQQNAQEIADENLDDWDKKYDITLNALSQEYYSCLETIRQADEKANKYLVVISIFLAGLFTILSSDLPSNLLFETHPLNGASALSWLFIIVLVFCGGCGFIVIKALLESLDFIETRKLPDLRVKLLDEASENNYVEYKELLIRSYQAAINYNMSVSIESKQNKIRYASSYVKLFIGLMVLAIALLFLIELIK